MYFPFHFSWFSGRDETMQPAKPSFLEYFEQKEKENQINSFGKSAPGPLKNSSDWKVPQDGDYEFVSSAGSKRLCLLRKLLEVSHMQFCRLSESAWRFPVGFKSPPAPPGSRSRAGGLMGSTQRFDWYWSSSGSPNEWHLFHFKSPLFTCHFSHVEFEVVNGKRNIQSSTENALSLTVCWRLGVCPWALGWRLVNAVF